MPDNQYAFRATANCPDAAELFRISNCWQKRAIKLACIFVVAAISAWPIGSITAHAADAESIYKDIAPSIVMITSKNEEEKNISQGTGFVIDSSQIVYADESTSLYLDFQLGLEWHGPDRQGVMVLTNFHVIESAVSIELALSNGAKGFVARVLAEDPKADLALMWCIFPTTANAPPLKLSSERPQAGSEAHVIGCPKGQAFIISSGIISGFSTDDKEKIECILHSVPISPGSSGSPLVNKIGEVVGIASATIQGGQNLNVAAFASDAIKLITNVKYGRGAGDERSIKIAQKDVLSEVQSRIYDKETDDAARNALKAILSASADQDNTKIDITITALLKIEHLIPNDMVHIYDFYMGYFFLRAIEIEVGPLFERAKQSTDPQGAMQAAYRSSVSHSLATHHFAKSFIAKPDFTPAAYFHAAQLAIEGNYQKAFNSAVVLTQLMPYYYRAFYMKGEALIGLGKYTEAKTAFARACHLDPRNSLSLFAYGDVLEDLNEYEDSASAFLAAAKEGDKLSPFAYYRAAQSFQTTKQYRKANELYERAIALDSTRFITKQARQRIRHCQEMLSN